MIEYRVVMLVEPMPGDDTKGMVKKQLDYRGEDGWILASVFYVRTLLMAAFWREMVAGVATEASDDG